MYYCEHRHFWCFATTGQPALISETAVKFAIFMKYILLRVTGSKKWRDKLEELEEIERELEEIERELNERKTRLQGIFMSENSSHISSAA